MMKWVEIKDSEMGTSHVYAVNGEGEGFFHRAVTDNTYHQTQGTAQFSVKGLSDFLDRLRKREILKDVSEVTHLSGWGDDTLTERTARSLGWYLVRGNYKGTSDNRLDRWYWQRTGSDTLDFRGEGFKTKKQALEALLS